MMSSQEARRRLNGTSEAEALLKDWRKRLAAASDAHYKLASGLRRKNLWLGCPS